MGVVIIVGDFGAGKSTYLKNNFLNKTKKKKFVYALMKRDMPNLPYYSDFVEMVSDGVKVTDSLFVIDEASTCMPREQPDTRKGGRKGEDAKLILTWFLNARKCNNMIFIVYHALEEVPKWLVKYSDYFVRFRTNDMLQYQINRFRSFPSIVQSLQKYPTLPNFKFDTVKLR